MQIRTTGHEPAQLATTHVGYAPAAGAPV